MGQVSLIFLAILILPIQVGRQSKIHIVENDVELAYFQDDKVVYVELNIAACEGHSEFKGLKKCMKNLKFLSKVFRSGKISPSDIYEFTFESKSKNDIRYSDVKEEIETNYQAPLSRLLQNKGFRVINMHYLEIQNDTLKCQFHMGENMLAQFYGFQIDLKSKPLKLLPYDFEVIERTNPNNR